ncbi:hypothetical protein TrVFT333_004726 [Trichoderma virens FT-333]|nr:hypothetical protein TrVFT333_004726 [Trichoderma virens FT-333]
MEFASKFWKSADTTSPKPGYERLGQHNDRNHGDPQDRTRAAWRPTRMTIVMVAAAAFSIIGLSLVGIYQYYSTKDMPQSSTYPCGNSSTEARARGCTFDQLTWAWIPRQCSHYTNDLYLNATSDQPWKWYIEPHKKQLVTEDEWEQALNNEITVYGERREHHAHCVYMFLNLVHIWQSGGRHTPRQADYHHLEHCSQLLLQLIKDDPLGFNLALFHCEETSDDDEDEPTTLAKTKSAFMPF